ncbi:recombinase family protein [Actinomadura nitritigenes]|uniref:recombinase family protein n=1 Tax=Actinomadura nitritigenes TaxID=134602 RepID=UPI0027DCB045|nr:recombinase family protein [Actinomadura nitritigenes]
MGWRSGRRRDCRPRTHRPGARPRRRPGLRLHAGVHIRTPGSSSKFWQFDRWGRSAGHVLTIVTELRERGVKVISLTENYDLDSKEGRFMFAVLAAAAEYALELRA